MIEIRKLNKTHHNYGGHDIHAIKDLSLSFDNKGITIIGGNSGNGKSTLLSLIGGLDTFDDGNLFVNGIDLRSLNQKQIDAYRNNYVGFIFQDSNLISNLSVADNIRLGRAFDGEKISEERINEVLKTVRLEGFNERMPADLSGGEKRRVSIARTLISSPEVLLVDEPTSSLDQVNSDLIWDIIKNFSKTKLVIAITHRTDIIQQYGDRLVVLKKGEIESDKRLTPKPKNTRSKLVTDNIPFEQKLKKGNLSNNYTMGLAMSYLKSKKLSMFFVVLLSCLSLLFFSVFFILNSYNNAHALAGSVNKETVPYVIYYNGTQKNPIRITTNNKNQIEAALNKKSPTLIGNNLHYMTRVNYSVDFGSGFYSSNNRDFLINGFIESTTSSDLEVGKNNDLGQKILAGRYPTTDEVNNVVISDYLAELLLKYGAYVETAGSSTFQTFIVNQDNRYSDILNKTISINHGSITISGVYETDYKKYVDSSMAFRGYNEEEFDYKLTNIYSVLHVLPTYISGYANLNPSVDNIVVSLSKGNNKLSFKNATITNAAKFNNTIYYVNPSIDAMPTVNSINSTKIAISIDTYNLLIANLGYEPLDATTVQTKGYAYLGINQASDKNTNLTLSIFDSDSISYDVVGVFVENQADADNTQVVLSTDDYKNNALAQTTFGAYNLTINTTVGNSLIEKSVDALTELNMTFVSPNSYLINDFNHTISIVKTAFLITSIFTAVYSLMLMYYFISQMIKDRKADIGILRAIGAGKMDVAKIFILCSVFLALSIFVLTVILTLILSAIANVVVVSMLPLTTSVFSSQFTMYVYLALICIVVVIMGTTIPIYSYSKKAPNQLMKTF